MLLLLCGLLPPLPALAEGPEELLGRTVTRIEVVGVRQIAPGTVSGQLDTEPGSPLSAATVRRDIEAVFGLGFFSDVVIEGEPEGSNGVVVTVRVTELPALAGEVQVKGNRKVLKDTLLGHATGMDSGAFLTPADVLRARRGMLADYFDEGYLQATVVPVEVESTDEATGAPIVDLAFVVEEGKKTRVRHIGFSGNTAFSNRTLRGKLKSKRRFWATSWLTGSGIYRESHVEEDVLRLEDFYQNQGFMDVSVSPPNVELSDDRQWYSLTYPIVEGPVYRIGEVSVAHGDKLPEADLMKGLELATGSVYSRDAMRRNLGMLTDRLGEVGYALARVEPEFDRDPETGTVDVRYMVTEGDQITIRRINVRGNTKTRDKVIRREVRQQEGEVINTSLLRRTYQRILNLQYFGSVDIDTKEAGPGLLDLDITVEEKSTGQFSIGGGYSSNDGLVGLMEITQGNLGGRGQTLSGRLERSGRRTVYNLRFAEPYLFDTNRSFGFDLYRSERDFESYDEKRIGGGVNLGRSYGEYLSASLAYRYEVLDLKSPTGTIPGSPLLEAQLGRSRSSSVGANMAWDSRDNYLDPRRGMRHTLRTEVGGGYLAGTNDYVKGVLDNSVFFPLLRSMAFAVRSQLGYGAGYSKSELPAGERFFVGGIRTVRGFNWGEAGPLGTTGDPIGADKMWVMTGEITFPLVTEANIKGALFTDWGAGFDTGRDIAAGRMNLSVGWEIRWMSPVGPLRFGYGRVLVDKRHPDFQRRGDQFFDFGTFF
ncbi:MAG: outer membrane protein assembly factor BamA [Nitrospirota bacterium]|nr:outer membrane protein assembly factor BamA [Nitrospirota bacterium]